MGERETQGSPTGHDRTQTLRHTIKAKKKEVKVYHRIYEMLPFPFAKRRKEKHTGLRVQNIHRAAP